MLYVKNKLNSKLAIFCDTYNNIHSLEVLWVTPQIYLRSWCFICLMCFICFMCIKCFICFIQYGTPGKILVRDEDHFCPWTGTTIAGGNIQCVGALTGELCP